MSTPRGRLFTGALVAGLFFLSLSTPPVLADSPVKLWEEELVLPTFRVGEPEPNPIFYSSRAYQGAKGPVYPYPLLDTITLLREERTYNAVYLENRYVRLCVLPEIGGRIFFATDKTNSYDFFYRQHVIKPARIGMLGAWISGGVEWNFPHHHRATSFMAVDYTWDEAPDGSKTVWVGEMELRHRLKWVLGITLHPDRSTIEVTVKLFNPTPFVHSFLYWANVAVHANPGYQVIFPPSTEFATYHGKNQFSHWPISHEVYHGVDYTEGVDVSWWKSHPAPTSMFAWNCREDFLAGYDHGREAGVVHVANHHIVPGKKFWTWGTGPDGQMWEKILTETDGPYLELMVGAYSDNQPDYSWLKPFEVKIFRQYWYPIQKIGGVKHANREAALNLERISGNSVRMGIHATKQYTHAKVLLEAGGRVIDEQRIDIGPGRPFCREAGLPAGVLDGDIRLSLISGQGTALISYQPVEKKGNPLPKPVTPPPPPSSVKTIEELYLTGQRLEQFHNPVLEPLAYYEEALKRDRDDSRVNTALGILYCRRGMFEKAEERLERALARLAGNYTHPKDGEAHYYLGVASKVQGKIEEAYDMFYKALWDYGFYSAATYLLAELSCRKGDFGEALDHCNRALDTQRFHTKARCLKAVVHRKMKQLDEAENAAIEVLSIDPLNFMAGNELALLDSLQGRSEEAEKRLNALKILMREEPQSYLELALDYSNSGLWDEAIEILSRLAASPQRESREHPMVEYYLGYFWHQKGEKEKAREHFQLGSKRPPQGCFPFRLEAIGVFEEVLRYEPEDARAFYYLGNLLYDIQPERAIQEWERSRELDETFATVHRNLGLAYAQIEKNIPKAISSLEKGVACKRDDPRVYFELDLLYELGGVSPWKRLELLQKNHETLVKRDDALSREIILLVQVGQADKAIELLSSHHFHTWEGGGHIRECYVNAHLIRGWKKFKDHQYSRALEDFKAALDFPENLEVAKPLYDRRAPQIDYFIGLTYEALGEEDRARTFYEKAAGWEEKGERFDTYYYRGMALVKLGQEEAAEKLFDELIRAARERLEESSSMDFFAKFGTRKSPEAQMAEAHYLLGLGYLGKGRREEARREFQKTLVLNINHLWAGMQLPELQ